MRVIDRLPAPPAHPQRPAPPLLAQEAGTGSDDIIAHNVPTQPTAGRLEAQVSDRRGRGRNRGRGSATRGGGCREREK